MVRVGDREDLQDRHHQDFPELQEGPELLQVLEQGEQVVPVEVQVLLHLVELVDPGPCMAVVPVEEEVEVV